MKSPCAIMAQGLLYLWEVFWMAEPDGERDKVWELYGKDLTRLSPKYRNSITTACEGWLRVVGNKDCTPEEMAVAVYGIIGVVVLLACETMEMTVPDCRAPETPTVLY